MGSHMRSDYGYVADDLGWPIIPENTPISAIFVAFRIFVMCKCKNFKFGS